VVEGTHKVQAWTVTPESCRQHRAVTVGRNCGVRLPLWLHGPLLFLKLSFPNCKAGRRHPVEVAMGRPRHMTLTACESCQPLAFSRRLV
jgi:hypothetical protein